MYRLPFAERGRGDRGHDDVLTRLPIGRRVEHVEFDLGFRVSIHLELVHPDA